MTITMLKGKIHRATVRQSELNYVGSITVDAELLDAAGILEYEKVQIADVDNGARFETYTIAGEPGSGMICLNGAAAVLSFSCSYERVLHLADSLLRTGLLRRFARRTAYLLKAVFRDLIHQVGHAGLHGCDALGLQLGL